MLILSRRSGESIRIDEHITIRILTVKGRHVSVGIAAPRTVTIDREEIYQRKREREALSQSGSQ